MRAIRTSLAVLAALLALTGTSAARSRPPHLSWIKCASACTDPRTVAPGGEVKLAGSRFPRSPRVIFPVRGGKTRSLKPLSASPTRIVVSVPADARGGRLYVRGRPGVRTNNSRWLWIRKRKQPPPTTTETPPPPTGTAFDGNGMWIWYVSKAEGGDLSAIVNRAKAHGIATVFVKSGDGGSYWTQFSPSLVKTLHAAGLHVCSWQYVYGNNPGAEAAVAARSVTEGGADCFVIDAEAEYEKDKYAAAQTYVDDLRAAVGKDFPVGLAGFPYVDYHPSFPYSVFLGPNGAQFNVPQAYWKTIGGSPDTVLAHTYRFNRPYGRTIAPLGQTYDSPPSSEIVRFRQLSAAAGATGLSWWSWQHTSSAGWDAVGQGITQLASGPPTDFASLAKGAKGDLVIWAQQHLKGAGQPVPVDGTFGTSTETAVKNFQAAAGLEATGTIDTATWQALLTHTPAKVKWSTKPTAPRAAKLAAPRYEIPSGIGSG